MAHDYSTIRKKLTETYNRHALDREKHRETPKGVEKLDSFIALLKKQDKRTVLEIGSGNGVDSAYFKKNGLSAVSVDLAIENARLCREKDLAVCVTDVCNIGLQNQSFDAVWTVQCLFHIPKNMLPSALKDIHRILKPGGLLYASIGGGPDREEIWEEDYFNPPRFFSFHSDEAIKQTMSQFFSFISFEEQDVRSEDMHQQTMLLQKGNL